MYTTKHILLKLQEWTPSREVMPVHMLFHNLGHKIN